jgi:hypothetical protein
MGGKILFSPVLKVPRQCPLVLPVEVRLREGKALGSEKGKGLGCVDFVITKGEKFIWGFTSCDQNWFFLSTLEVLHYCEMSETQRLQYRGLCRV